MAEFKVGDRVNCTFDPDNKDDPWNGVGTVERSRTHDLTKVRLDSGRFANLTDAEMTPVVETFQPGDIVRAEKGDEIIQAKVYEISSANKKQYLYGKYVVDTFLEKLEKEGYTLTLVKRPEPEIVLPTNPYAIVFSGGASHIRGFGEMWYLAFGKDNDGITSGQLLAKATADKDYRVIFEGENE